MKEYPAYYVGRRSKDDEGNEVVPYAIVEVLGGQLDWYAVDGGQLVKPVRLIETDSTTFDDPPIVVLKQYDGDKLARQLIAADLDAGDQLHLSEDELGNFGFEPVD